MKTNPTTQIQFTPCQKMADLLFANYTLISLLPRFGISLGFGEKIVSEVCKEYHVTESLFLLICNLYTYPSYFSEKGAHSRTDINALITYLKASHTYYLTEKITRIEQMLHSMEQSGNTHNIQIIATFFEEYKKEVINHFDYEEQVVFPYITNLLANKIETNYHIHQFEENHSNIEDKLSDLKNIIIKYLPPETSSKPRIELLFELFWLEEELNRHSLIEEKLLIPFVEEIEQAQKQKRK